MTGLFDDIRRGFARLLLVAMLGVAAVATTARAQVPDSRFADVNGTRIHYLVAGKGEPIILLHGFAQTNHMWRPLIAELAKTNLVIAPDLRGFGRSAKPPKGYDKKTMAQDIHALAAIARASSASGSSDTTSG